jgi:hypothetical protein
MIPLLAFLAFALIVLRGPRLLKFLGVLFGLAAPALLVYAFYTGASVNWDVPTAMITAHQGWDAFVAFLVPAIGAFVSLILGLSFYAWGEK